MFGKGVDLQIAQTPVHEQKSRLLESLLDHTVSNISTLTENRFPSTPNFRVVSPQHVIFMVQSQTLLFSSCSKPDTGSRSERVHAAKLLRPNIKRAIAMRIHESVFTWLIMIIRLNYAAMA